MMMIFPEASGRNWVTGLLFSVSIILLTSCGGGGSSGGGGATNSVAETFDASGGELSSSDGQLTLMLPEGALDGNTQISIKQISPDDLPDAFDDLGITQAYELGPSGLQFNSPITLRFPFSDDELDPANLQGLIGANLYTSNNGMLETLSDVSLELDDISGTATLTGRLSHFSPVALGKRSIFDGALVENVPHVVDVRQPFSVNVKLSHRAGSGIEADLAAYVERVIAFGIEPTDKGREEFGNEYPFTWFVQGEIARSFGVLTKDTPKNEEVMIEYECNFPGIFPFDAKLGYYSLNEENKPFEQTSNTVEFFRKILCKDQFTTNGAVQVEDFYVDDEELITRASWLFSASPSQIKAKVGDTFTLTLSENGPFGITAGDTYLIDFVDTVPGVLSAPSLGNPPTPLGATAVNFKYPSKEPLMQFQFVAGVNSQRLDFTCQTTGATVLGFELVVMDNLPQPDGGWVASDIFLVNVSCGEDHSSVPNDSDADGFSADQDYCLNATGPYNGCPIVETNGKVTQYCATASHCDTGEGAGNCSDCTVTGGDGWASVCDADSFCSYRSDDVRECTGGCTMATEGFQASCADGSQCSVGPSLFSCESDAKGNGCAINLNNGETLGCPTPGVACKLLASKTVSDLPVGMNSNKFTIRTVTQAGDGEFQFDWNYSDNQVPLDSQGDFQITTQNGAGTRELQLVTANAGDQFSVQQTPAVSFELSSVGCVPPEAVSLATDLVLTTGVGETVCDFLNVSSAPPTNGVFSGPDGASAVEECSIVAGSAFGLNSTEPLIACGSATRSVIINPLTGTVPYAQSQRLSFDNSITQTFGSVVWLDPQSPGQDLLYAFGGNGSLSRIYDVNSGLMGGIIADFANTTQAVHLGGDPAADTLLRVENSINRIDALVPNTNTGSGWQTREIIQSRHLQDLDSPVVSAFAYSLGNSDCFNPCQNGSNMPFNCSVQIDAVLAADTACATYWGKSCVTTYNQNNGNFCDLPGDQRQVNFGGMVIGVTGGSPSQLFLADPAYTFFGRAQVIGTTGNEARRVSCVASICAVTNYASNTLSIVHWDGLHNASIVDTVAVGTGPIGLSLREVNGNVQILTSGSLANNYTFTEVSAAGSVLSSTTTQAPSGCLEPSWVLWLPDTDSAVISCTGSDAYAVIQP